MKKTNKMFVMLVCIVVVVIAMFVIILQLFPNKYNEIITEKSRKYNIEKHIVASVINIESRYDKKAVSHVGAIGLMQILPSTAEEIALKLGDDYEQIDLFDEETNIEYGCFYLRYLLDLFDGNIINALASYNWGLNNVKKWIKDGNVDESFTITNIPVKETKNYIKKFKSNSFVYNFIYGL